MTKSFLSAAASINRHFHPASASLASALLLLGLLRTNSFAQLSGSLDASFDPNAGSAATPEANTVAYVAISLTNGQVIIGGNFTTYDDVPVGRLARLNADGTLDTSFNSGGAGVDLGAYANPSGVYPNATKLLPNGQLYIGGPFESYNGVAREGIARINADGSLDASFDPGTGGGPGTAPLRRLLCVSLQTNGQVVIGGDFTNFNGVSHSKIARLNSNGSLDSSFNPSANATVRDVMVLPDGKIMLCGQFANVNGTPINKIARLNSDGTLDNSFNPGSGIAGALAYAMALQPDSKIIIGGIFDTYNDLPATNIFRINPDGSLDTSFNTGTGPNGQLGSVFLQPDGKVLIGGVFSKVNGYPLTGVARLNADGSVDKTFDSGIGASPGIVYHFAFQQGDTNNFGPVTNKVIMVGEYSTFNLDTQNHVARLYVGDNVGIPATTVLPGSPGLAIARSGSSVVLSWPVTTARFTLQQERALNNTWTTVTNSVVVINNQNTVTIPIGADPTFYRLKF